MNQSSILIAAAIIAACGALIEQLDSKKTTQRHGVGGAKIVTVHKSSG